MKDRSIEDLTNHYGSRGVLIDTNILLLLYVGTLDESLVKNFKRTKHFFPGDYKVLRKYLRCFKVRATTPNILTEVSNLGKQLGRSEDLFKNVLPLDFVVLHEEYTASKIIAEHKDFAKFGLTDVGIIEQAYKKRLLLTDDWALAGSYKKNGGDAVNFNHLRNIDWKQICGK